MRILIAIDDTDNPNTVGTGRLARTLGEVLEEEGLMDGISVTRHQNLVHPDIPYTSHNSSACLGGEAREEPEKLLQRAVAFLQENFHQDANPGLCVARPEAVPPEVVAFGRRAQREVLRTEQALELAARFAIPLWGDGETGQGRIGALGAVGLRAAGDDGRFIGLRGIRSFQGEVRVGEILAHSDVGSVETEEGTPLPESAVVDTLGWVRPSLRRGQPVLVVRREEDGVYRPANRMKRGGW